MVRRSLMFAALTAVAIGCVVIPNKFEADIRVEIRHIEEQADDVLDYIEGGAEPGSEARRQPSVVYAVLDALAPIRVAHAQALNATSDDVKKHAQSLRERAADVAALKKSGSVQEDNRGYLKMREDADAMADADAKNEAQKIIAGENEDRKNLYKAIAEANSKPGATITLTMVEAIYADQRRERAASGEWVQLPPAGERFEAFKTSSLGKKLGDSAQPDAWVQVP